MSADAARARLRQTLVGYSQEQLCGFLEAAGYRLARQGRHGAIYRNAELAERHPDLAVRRRYAYVEVPKGRELKAVYARNVLEALEILEAWQQERSQ